MATKTPPDPNSKRQRKRAVWRAVICRRKMLKIHIRARFHSRERERLERMRKEREIEQSIGAKIRVQHRPEDLAVLLVQVANFKLAVQYHTGNIRVIDHVERYLDHRAGDTYKTILVRLMACILGELSLFYLYFQCFR